MKKQQLLCIGVWFILLSALPTVAYPPHDVVTEPEAVHMYSANDPLNKGDDAYRQAVLVDQLDQEQPTSCGEGIRLFNASWLYAQNFRPSLGILTRVELFLGREGTLPEDLLITVSIKNSLYHDDLTMASINGSGITNDGGWVEFNFTYLGVEQEKIYYIIFKINKNIKGSYVLWFFDINDPYTDGEPYVSENNGQSWHSLEKPPGFPNKDFCFKTYGLPNQSPNKPILPNGETKGHYGTEYNYTTTSLDGDGNMLYYFWDWGDGTTIGWLGPYNSGFTIKTPHTWMVKGSYLIRVKAKDIWNFESEWSDSLAVRMNKNKISLLPFTTFFQWYGSLRVGWMVTRLSSFS
jgi:hypothetical protein